MNKKTIIIGAFSSLLVTGGIGGAAAVLINAASKNDGISLNEGVKFTKEDISKLLDSFQEQINKNKYSLDQFKTNIKEVVKISLTLNNKPAFTLMQDASYDNNEIVITLNPQYEYSLSETYDNIKIDTNKDKKIVTLTISDLNLQFFDSCTITNTQQLFDKIQEYIDNNKETVIEFGQKLQDKDAVLIDLIQNNLLVDNNGNNQPIEKQNIENIEFVNNKLEITLDANYLSYSISNNNSSSNVELKTNKIIVSNLTFYNAILVENTKLNQLQNNIQTLINNNQYTLNDFNTQLISLTFKNQIANYLNIFPADINTILFEQGILKIVPNTNSKFISTANNNLIVDNTIQVENLEFYNSLTLTKLNDLYNAINTYIGNQKLTVDAFENLVNSNTVQILNLIKSNLYVLNNGNEELIDANKIKSFKFVNNQLEIQLDTHFMKYITTTIQDNVVLENNKIIVKNFNYFELIRIDINNLNSLKQNIQNLIDTSEWTQNEFSNQLTLEYFKNEVAKYLGVNNYAINTITFVNDILEISSPVNKKYEPSSYSPLITANFTIQLTGFNFYTVANLTQLDILYNAINTYIANNKFTINEFENEVNDNNDAIRQLIVNNLKVNAQTINLNWIESISFINNDDNQQLEVTLNNYYIRYELTQTNNVKFENNKLIISKMQYYTAVQIENLRLNNLKQNIQSFIQNSPEKLTVEDFKNQLNSNLFRTKIAEYLNISINSIGNITYDNNVLKIMPNSMYKFTCDQENLLIVDDYIKLETFNFYQAYELTNLDELYVAINNYIALETNKFTSVEFANNVSSTPNNIKEIIANSLQLTDSAGSQNIDISYINNVQFTNNQLEITLSTNYLKYESTSTNNVEFENNKLIIKNLNFYELIHVDLNSINNVKNWINDLIRDDRVIENNINSYLNNQIFDWLKKVTISGMTGQSYLEPFINIPTYENNTIIVTLKKNIGLYKFALDSYTNIEINENAIILKNINLYTPPPSSPVNWFTWNGTQITGLSSLGAQQQDIVLPEITTSLFNPIWYKNNFIKKVDMSLTKITAMPILNRDGLFEQSTVETVILPNNLIDMGQRTFYGANTLINLKIPNTVTNISRDYVFYGCSKLKINDIPKNVKGTIGYFAFADVPLQSITIPNGITMIHSYTFARCKQLTNVKLSDNLETINPNAFEMCEKLTEITLPDTIKFIGNSAFYGIPNLVVYVTSNEVENLVKTVFTGTVINLNRP